MKRKKNFYLSCRAGSNFRFKSAVDVAGQISEAASVLVGVCSGRTKSFGM